VERYKASLNQPKCPTQTESSSFDLLDDNQWSPPRPVIPEALDSTLPVVHTALESERAAAELAKSLWPWTSLERCSE
jgi:hypothetical protein